MLTGDDSTLWHIGQNLALIGLSLVFLPLDTAIACLSLLLSRLRGVSKPVETQHHEQHTILVTGVGMSKGLTLARAFHAAGHRVIGADFEENGALVCGRVSASLHKFCSLRKPNAVHGSVKYVEDLVQIIKNHNVQLWVSCSGVASAIEDGEAREAIERETACAAIQFNVQDTSTLHEKHSFIEHTKSLGLTVPETQLVTSRADAEDKLLSGSNKQFIMKCVGLDDSFRADMTLLPLPSEVETKAHLSRLNITESNPWIIQQFIRGNEYCTHSVVVRGQVEAFVACPSLELLMHYEALPADSPLNQAMLKFTRTFASNGGPDFTGHLSFDFLVEDETPQDPEQIVLYPIECNPRAHTAVVLFSDTPRMVDAYLRAVRSKSDALNELVTPNDPGRYYWIGHDLVYKVILPTWHAASLNQQMDDLFIDLRDFLDHLLWWRDGTFSAADPWPWWWLYHVYWPMNFLQSILARTKWSRVNVSTTKMFMC